MCSCTHPVEIGVLGRFKYGGKDIVEQWMALEELFIDSHASTAIWSSKPVVFWALWEKIITKEEGKAWLDRC